MHIEITTEKNIKFLYGTNKSVSFDENTLHNYIIPRVHAHSPHIIPIVRYTYESINVKI